MILLLIRKITAEAPSKRLDYLRYINGCLTLEITLRSPDNYCTFCTYIADKRRQHIVSLE